LFRFFVLNSLTKWGIVVFDTAIIGCGIVGAATAYELSRYHLNIAVFEKANDVACGATKANSAIIHAGYDPEPGSIMAALNVRGTKLAFDICKKLDVPHKKTGALVLAICEEDIGIIEILYDRGKQNGIQDIQLISGCQALEMEPNLNPSVLGALYAPNAGVVSPWEYALAMAETAVRNGVTLHLESEIVSIQKTKAGFQITAKGGMVCEARTVINAAGIHAADIHNLACEPAYTIRPNRGQYYLLDKSQGTQVSRVIFQRPTIEGKGVLVAPTVHGNLIVGPSSEYVDGKNIAVTREGLIGVAHMAHKSVPGLNLRENIRNFAGLRAFSDLDDFIIAEADGTHGFFDLAGIKSPGLTAAPAIAEAAVELLRQSGLVLEEKEHFIDTRRVIRFRELDVEQKILLIKANPAYGRVICRCETITEGEILDTLHTVIPPRSLDGVKRRVNAGMGRCQGSFCSPKVLKILARALGISPTLVPQDQADSWILTENCNKKVPPCMI